MMTGRKRLLLSLAAVLGVAILAFATAPIISLQAQRFRARHLLPKHWDDGGNGQFRHPRLDH